MQQHHRSIAVLWSTAAKLAPGYLIGSASPSLLCVIETRDADQVRRAASTSLQSLTNRRQTSSDILASKSSTHVIGVACRSDQDALALMQTLYGGRKRLPNIWISVDVSDGRQPALLHCYARDKSASNVHADFLFYEPPNPAKYHFYALGHPHFAGTSLSANAAPAAVPPMRAHTWLSSEARPHSGFDCATMIGWINASAAIQPETHTLQHWMESKMHDCTLALLSFVAACAKPILRLLHSICNRIPTGASSFVQQSLLRAEMLRAWPEQYTHSQPSSSIAASQNTYLNLYNAMWLVINDVILGIAIGSFVIHNASYVADCIQWFGKRYAVSTVHNTINWLMSWPAGLKLNGPLAAFYGDLFLWILQSWATILEGLSKHVPLALTCLGVLSHCGVSIGLSLVSDVLSVATFHFHLFYTLSARIFNWQISIMLSLFYLFQGKKWNVLRKRLDTCDYGIDQLLLGTIVFTLLLFLLPTTAVYYLYFASIRVALVLLQTSLETTLALLNNFPLFILMLRVKDARRLPGNIRLERLPHHRALHNYFAIQVLYRHTSAEQSTDSRRVL
ncbi:pig-Q [Sorochytrium milnesiophthora]